ncbi:uncharacterized protein LOC131239462 isoform X1 [Magnolia sinica]|uniref:uncharacterized protein LOC131239462 isoform X1 n=1 Tax=Magnolia sinica TaxID=86752 RepID=UPI0026580652|nr:uncharacterized protein LOC131239462 isoform X1 [Magnolia sinica]
MSSLSAIAPVLPISPKRPIGKEEIQHRGRIRLIECGLAVPSIQSQPFRCGNLVSRARRPPSSVVVCAAAFARKSHPTLMMVEPGSPHVMIAVSAAGKDGQVVAMDGQVAAMDGQVAAMDGQVGSTSFSCLLSSDFSRIERARGLIGMNGGDEEQTNRKMINIDRENCFCYIVLFLIRKYQIYSFDSGFHGIKKIEFL